MGPSGPPVSAISPSACCLERADLDVCGASVAAASKCARLDELHQVGVAGLVHRKQRDRPVRLRARLGALRRHAAIGCRACAPRNRRSERTPTIGWMPASASLSENSSAPKRLLVSVRPSAGSSCAAASLASFADRQRAFEQRIGRMHLEVHELRVRGRRSVGGGRRATRSVHVACLDHRAAAPKGYPPAIPGQA